MRQFGSIGYRKVFEVVVADVLSIGSVLVHTNEVFSVRGYERNVG